MVVGFAHGESENTDFGKLKNVKIYEIKPSQQASFWYFCRIHDEIVL
jgi:hypothetical protein